MPAKKPAEQRRREGGTAKQGTISHRPAPKTVVLSPRISEQTKPARPEDLPPRAMALWDDAIQQLIDMNAAQSIDLPALLLMAIHYEMALRSWDLLCQEGWFIRGSTGQVAASPAVAMFNEASAKFKSYASEFGLTTLARTRLGTLELARTSMAHDLLQSGLGRNPLRAELTETTT